MNTELLADIRSRSFESLGLSPEWRNRTLGPLFAQRPSHKQLRLEAQRVTVGWVMDEIGGEFQPGEWRWLERKFAEVLLNLGLTHVDWYCLPPETAESVLHLLTKDEITALNIRVLDVFQAKALARLSEIIGKPVEVLTVGNVVDRVTYSKLDDRLYSHFSKSFLNAYNKLRTLGFKYEDGPFFQEGTHRWVREQLRDKYHLSDKVSETMMRVGEGEGWISYPIPEPR